MQLQLGAERDGLKLTQLHNPGADEAEKSR